MEDKKPSKLVVTASANQAQEAFVGPVSALEAKYRPPGTSVTNFRSSLFSIHSPSQSLDVKSLYSVSSVLKARTHIGLLGCIIVIVGCVLGSGIFAAPQQILKITGNAGMTLLVWFLYGVITLVGALCFAELGCTIPVSGGDYAYLNECFGNFPAFLFQWSSNFIVIPASSAIMASVVANNLIIAFSSDIDLNGPVARWPICLLSIFFLMFFCYINCAKAEITERVQGSLMIVNIIAISLVVCCGIAKVAQSGISKDANFKLELPKPPASLTSTWDITKFQTLKIVQALYQASFSYFGYTYLNYITEDLENPMRNLPLGICISIPIIIFLNVFVNFWYIATLPNKRIMNTRAIASEMFGEVLPPGTYLPYVSWIAPILVAIAVTGGLSGNILTCSRISFTGARNGHFPKMFCMVQMDNKAPIVSIVWIGIQASFFVLIGDIPLLIAIATYLETAFNCLCIYGLIYLRIKKPELPRPIKVPLVFSIIYSIVSTFLFFVPILSLDSTNWRETLPGIGGAIFVVFTGIPVYFIFIFKQRPWPRLQWIQGRFMRFLQKLWLIIPEDQIIFDENDAKEIKNASADEDKERDEKAS